MVHSMVEFLDGSTIAQASPPRMLLPIALGLGWPDRLPASAPAVRLDHAPRRGSSSRSTTRRSPRSASPGASAQAGGTVPGGLQRGQRGVRRRVPRRPHPFLAIVDTVAAGAWTSGPAAHAGNDPGTLTVDVVLRAEAWARDAGPRTGRAGDDESATRRHALMTR